jgi:hypothetical protein
MPPSGRHFLAGYVIGVGLRNPRALLLIFLIMVLAASTVALVTRVASSIWVSGHHLGHGRPKPAFIAAALTGRSQKAVLSSTLAGVVAESISHRADVSCRPRRGPTNDSQLSTLAPLIGGTINTKTITTHWDEILRLDTSIKTGTVTASVMMNGPARRVKSSSRPWLTSMSSPSTGSIGTTTGGFTAPSGTSRPRDTRSNGP